jgi:RNA polymerase sigma factor (sigma-70 family)
MNADNDHDMTRSRIEKTYREGRKGFLRRARRAAGSLVDAEDVVQDAFLAALANIDALTLVNNATSWVYTAIRNRAIDLWRRSRTREASGQIDIADETLSEIAFATGLRPDDAFILGELSDALVDAIDALPEPQRAVIHAQVFEGTTFREISEQSGIPIETLAARKRAAVRALGLALRGWIEED